MDFETYCLILSDRYDSAEGNGTDSSHDPGYKRNPNDFLAPIFGNNIFVTLASIAAILFIIVLTLALLGKLKVQMK